MGSFDNEDKEMLATMPLKSMLLGSTWNFVNESNGFKAQGPDVRVVTSISDSASTFEKPLIDYQSLVVTPTIIEATTESSYNYGAKMASKEWADCGVSSNGNCWSGSAICWGEPGSGYVPADNKTSCMNGFVNSWNELCRVQSKIAKIEQIQCPTSVGQEMPHF